MADRFSHWRHLLLLHHARSCLVLSRLQLCSADRTSSHQSHCLTSVCISKLPFFTFPSSTSPPHSPRKGFRTSQDRHQLAASASHPSKKKLREIWSLCLFPTHSSKQLRQLSTLISANLDNRMQTSSLSGIPHKPSPL